MDLLPHIRSPRSIAPQRTFGDYLNHTLGAVYIALLITTALYGVTCIHIFGYYRRHSRKDGPILKLFIFVLWMLTTLHVCLIASTMYTNLITNFGDLAAAIRIVWTISVVILISGLIEFTVRCLFIIRIWKLTDRNLPIVIFTTTLNIIVLGFSSYLTWKAFHTEFYSSLFGTHEWTLVAGFILDSIVDIAITGTISLFLWKKRTGFASTDGVMMAMIKFSINTGLLTALISIMVLVSFLVIKDSYVFAVFYFPIAPVFLNSLLISLNARDSMLKIAQGNANKFARNNVVTNWPNNRVARCGDEEDYRSEHFDGALTNTASNPKGARDDLFIAVTIERTTHKTTDDAV